MKRGAVVMMDILGFKGITKRHKPEVVVAAMRQLRQAALDEANAREMEFRSKLDKRIEVKVVALSDTIVIAASLGPAVVEGDRADVGPIFCAGVSAAAVVKAAARAEPSFALRGVITFGDFHLEDDSIIAGPAIDEAATLERAAEAAIVWMAPCAVAALGATKVQPFDIGFFRYRVPMKGGGKYETAVVNPYHWTNHVDVDDERSEIRDGFLRAFGKSLDVGVQIKRQNTERFLKKALEQRVKG